MLQPPQLRQSLATKASLVISRRQDRMISVTATTKMRRRGQPYVPVIKLLPSERQLDTVHWSLLGGLYSGAGEHVVTEGDWKGLTNESGGDWKDVHLRKWTSRGPREFSSRLKTEFLSIARMYGMTEDTPYPKHCCPKALL